MNSTINAHSTINALSPDKLDPYVREKFSELWHASRPATKRYVTIWRNKFVTSDAQSLDEIIAASKVAATTLEAMLADGVVLDRDGGTGDDHAYLVTTDPAVAKKYDMHDESEFFDEGEGAKSM